MQYVQIMSMLKGASTFAFEKLPLRLILILFFPWNWFRAKAAQTHLKTDDYLIELIIAVMDQDVHRMKYLQDKIGDAVEHDAQFLSDKLAEKIDDKYI